MTKLFGFWMIGALFAFAPMGQMGGVAQANDFISGTEARRLIAEKGAVLIDVRTAEERAEKHILGSLWFPVQTISDDLARLGDFNRPTIVYCRSGMRAAKAKQILEKAGFKEVYNLGSVENWDT
ncbi:MAG: rhodanese-like domain-containing protein [Bdellovibrionota bacterium]